MHSTHETLQTAVPELDGRTRARPAAEEPPLGLEQITVELERTNRAVAALLARIDEVGADAEVLDALTEQIVDVLARVEQLRCARAQWHAAQRRDAERWADYLDVA